MSITPSLVASRTSGAAPLYVHFDATATDSTATSFEFHECKFTWDFGDTTPGNWSTTGKSRNVAYGAVAGHVFETAGDYTVTLTVKDADGTTASTTQGISVTAADTQWATTSTVCISQAGNFTGKPTGATEVTTSSWATAMGYLASGYRVLLRKGETWTGTAVNKTNVRGNVMLGAFGTGSNPVINVATGIVLFNLTSCDDWRVCDLTISGVTDNSDSSGFNLSAGYSGTNYGNTFILLSRCEISGFRTTAGGNHGQFAGPILVMQRGVCYFESYIHHGYIQAVYLPCEDSDFLGSRIENSSTSHTWRVPHARSISISNCAIRWAGNDRLLLKLHNDDSLSARTTSKYIVVSDSEFESSAAQPWGVDFGPQDNAANEAVEDVLFERNKVKMNQRCLFFTNTKYCTAKNNIFQAQTGGATDDFYGVFVEFYSATAPTVDYIWIYNNTMYSSRTEANEAHIVRFASGAHLVARNNYGSAPNTTGNKDAIVDNTGAATLSNNTMTDTPGWVSAGTNFRLTSGSAAINTGSAVATVYDDMDNVTRVANYEQGAYEYASGGDPGTAILWGVVI